MISSIWPPSNSPVPRMMARLMLSAGMLAAFASVMALRRRGLASGSPPPARAAIMISLMMRVNIFPRLASVAAFLCLMVAHLECPDMVFPLARALFYGFLGEPNTLEYHAAAFSLTAACLTSMWCAVDGEKCELAHVCIVGQLTIRNT